ncbi:MAG: ABC transporter substrate-binding protein [Rhizobiaceae bacterium]
MFRILLTLLFVAISLPAAIAADVIGLSLPMNGRFAPIAQRMEFGALMAIEDLRATGQEYELKLVDDGCDPKAAVTQANALLEAKAKIVVGSLCFKQAIALVKALNTNNGDTPTIPVVTSNTRNRLLKRLRDVGGLPLYSLSNQHNAEAMAVIKHILPRFKGKPFAIIDDGSVYGRSLSDEIRLLGEPAGFKAITTSNFRPQQTSQAALLRRLKSSGVEAIFIAASARDIITISRDMKKLGYDWIIGSAEQAALLPYTEGARDVPTGLMMVREADPGEQNAKAILDRLKGKNEGLEPSLLTGYALVQIAAETIKKNNAPLTDSTFSTVLGKLQFSEEGRASPLPFSLYQWNGSAYGAVSGN